MFVLIASGVTYDFVDPLQFTVMTPLAISSKSQNNVGTQNLISFSKTTLGFFYLGLLLFFLICDNSYYRILKDRCIIFHLVAMESSGHAMLPHMCDNILPHVK